MYAYKIKYYKFHQMAILSFSIFFFFYRKLLSNRNIYFFCRLCFLQIFLPTKKKKRTFNPYLNSSLSHRTHTYNISMAQLAHMCTTACFIKKNIQICTTLYTYYNLKIILHGRTLLKFKHVFTILFDLDKGYKKKINKKT